MSLTLVNVLIHILMLLPCPQYPLIIQSNYHLPIHSPSLHWHTFKFINLSTHFFTHISINLPFSSIFFLPIQLPVLYLAFIHLSYTHILISVNIVLHHFYTYLPSIHVTIHSSTCHSKSFHQLPTHPITNLSILLFNPIHFFTQLLIHPAMFMYSCTQISMIPSPIFLYILPTIFPFIILWAIHSFTYLSCSSSSLHQVFIPAPAA